jgi:hypothetical protein
VPANNDYTRDVMTDVQVTNARRIGFTALALVAFWISAHRLYYHGYDHACGDYEQLGSLLEFIIDLGGTPSHGEHWSVAASVLYLAALLGLVPTVLFSLSLHTKMLKLQDPWVFVSGALLVTTTALSLYRGDQDAAAEISAVMSQLGVYPFVTHPHSLPAFQSYPLDVESFNDAQESHAVPCLLLPIILTTALVIFEGRGVPPTPLLLGG